MWPLQPYWASRNTCWKIHGKLANWTPRRQSEGRGFQAQTSTSDPNINFNKSEGSESAAIRLNKEQIEQLYKLLNQSSLTGTNGDSNIGSCSVAQHGIFISQQKYELNLLSETWKLGCKPVETPIEQNHKLCEAAEDTMVDRESYQRLVGRLIYLPHTRSDMAYAVGVVSPFMHNPKKVHLQVAHRILQYLKEVWGEENYSRKEKSWL